jgi:4-aminobutyrate aminotransferase/(S)-3-amino-2-methylpropionate transaminase
VLDVIETEGLLQRGLDMGAQIDSRLRKMEQRNSFDCIGDVRALGCMNAIEIVKDRDGGEPDADLTAKVASNALKNGLILVTAGPARNVIRLLVPLTASTEVVEEGLDILENSLEESLA